MKGGGKFSPSGRLGKRGFLLLDALLSVTIGLVVICGAFGISTWCVKAVLFGLGDIEREEFALSAIYTVFHFARYGSSVVPVENGEKLCLFLGNNQVTLYRRGRTLLLGHRETANPIAEECTGITFTLSENLLGTTLVFGERTYVLQVVREYFTR